MEALTKFINGHGDAQGGAIISNSLYTIDHIRYEAQVNVGSVVSPFNAWQIQGGSVIIMTAPTFHSKVGAVI